MISIDDFSKNNIKLANIIKEYGLENNTIFFIECMLPEAQDQIACLHKMGFNIGSHTMTHSHLTKINDEQVEWELSASKSIIENITEKKCEWLCLPRGRWEYKHINMIDKAGYKYIRSTKIFDMEQDKKGMNNTTIHACPIRPEYEGKDWVTFFDEYLQKSKEENGNFKFWMHIEEIMKYDIMDEVENCFKKIADIGIYQ